MALIQPLLVGCFTSSHVPEPVACIRFKIGLANTLFLAHEWKNDELFNSGNRAIFSAQLILLQPKKGWLILPFAKQWHPTPVLLLGESHGRRSLVGCSPWGRWESDTTERLHFHFSLSCIGEGNGNPLWCFCLENPRDAGAWWAAVYGVAQSQTGLKWLSSSSRSKTNSETCLFLLHVSQPPTRILFLQDHFWDMWHNVYQ